MLRQGSRWLPLAEPQEQAGLGPARAAQPYLQLLDAPVCLAQPPRKLFLQLPHLGLCTA